ncbi:sulfotransferase [Planktothrix agardhii CCAP 1459/11A]|jgi:tetratricopeptide (TPR) repeat protein|uniref:Sulfotransferase n=1 Tax=Planktothrix agardhii CCAP 1459/11A TaxID=282420 RepID=A0A4V0XUZ5_PLAAG|nr:sulfotransferase [Planktothrix agardhii]MCF3608692.1 sulfotransferase [Planktothrix agardhii 1033]BBD57025.1 sulfotransferase [Planktothrix agardhii NIES-204]MCB8753355.1 sulfotransferase [Planktothrix agardhii 1810]MCB8761914.1 sulfotransferase [Planktothrix agardhii 1813]MCF3568893.1 sulfotransferase [Planktothrix agardhii 1807]
MTAFCQSNLIFLISQPRAGSTLTQRILGTHREIYTVSEPWIMLHPLYAMRRDGYQAEYSIQNSQRALDNFLNLHPEGEDAYFQAVRQMNLPLYQGLLQTSGKRYFLDKTPRYYYILPELYRTFPEAKYILLLRNPLAILCSIFNTFIQDNWWRTQYYHGDLLKAPSLIAQGLIDLQNKSLVLQYEKLLVNPEIEIERVCNFLNVPFDAEIISYGDYNSEKWQFGDRSLIDQENKPMNQNCDRWQENLQNPIIWQSANNYLEFIGKDLLTDLGYSYTKLKEILEKQKPKTQVILPPALQDFFASASMFLDKSLQPVQGVIGLTAQLFDSYLSLGKVLLQENQVDPALKYLEIALQMAPFVPETHCLIGEALLRIGKLDRAITYYQKAVQLGAKIHQNQLQSSKIALQQALQLNPTHQAIAELLAII